MQALCAAGSGFPVALLLLFTCQREAVAQGARQQQINIESRIVETQRSYLKQVGISFEMGGVIARESLPLSGTFGSPPPPQSPSDSQAFVGGDVRVPLPIPFSLDGAGPVTVGSLVIGVNFRSFLGNGGTGLFDIHPNSQPMKGTSTRNSSVTPYVGLPIQIGPTQPDGVTLIVTPKIGPTFENITLNLEIDEAGSSYVLQRDVTRTGVTGGIDVDVVLPTKGDTATPFVGLAGEITSMPSVPLLGDTPLFGYLFRNSGGISGAVKARAGLLIFVAPTIVR
jgi:hypothetical protein